jgi:peroxiredoxin
LSLAARLRSLRGYLAAALSVRGVAATFRPVPSRRVARVPAGSLVVPLLLLTLLACGDAEQPAASAKSEPAVAANEAKPPPPAAPVQPAQAKPAPPPRREPPLPAFEGITLDGKPFAASDLLGKRALVFFFNPAVPEAAPAAEAVAHVAALRGAHNFEIVGVALGSSGQATREFAKTHALDFAIVEDTTGSIAGGLGLRAPVALLGVDADGYVVFYHGGASPGEVPDAVAVVEAQLRESLRLPAADALAPELGERPKAPGFRAQRLDGSGTLESASLRGKPFVLIFFLYTCPHCHHALAFLRDELPKLPEATRPQVIGVSVHGTASEVKARLAQDRLDFFPVLADDDFALRTAYGVIAGVPDLFFVDKDGAIATRIQGWRDDRDPALGRMWLAKLAGQTPPMLLHASGYSGNEACVVCHERESETWLLTQHAGAFDTLVKHAASTDAECVGCHVVGWGQPGGYAISPPTRHLENVGCETCHGRGGPHLSPAFAKKTDYADVCATCHDPKHSLGFDYATFLPQVSHATNEKLAALPLAEKQKILAARGGRRSPLLPTTASYVGSQACQACHQQEFDTWSKQQHARALASLEAKNATGQGECLACHTTAYGRPGGFPKDAKPADHADLARVGCESCHGPGGDHVGADAARVGTIVSLTDKCDSCVILQICGACHDAANDPGFEFEVKQKIEAQKHGTKPPAAMQPAPSAATLPSANTVGALERGFAQTDPRS